MPTNQAWDPCQQERQKILKAQREQMPTAERGTATQGYGLLAQPWPECTSEVLREGLWVSVWGVVEGKLGVSGTVRSQTGEVCSSSWPVFDARASGHVLVCMYLFKCLYSL